MTNSRNTAGAVKPTKGQKFLSFLSKAGGVLKKIGYYGAKGIGALGSIATPIVASVAPEFAPIVGGITGVAQFLDKSGIFADDKTKHKSSDSLYDLLSQVGGNISEFIEEYRAAKKNKGNPDSPSGETDNKSASEKVKEEIEKEEKSNNSGDSPFRFRRNLNNLQNFKV